MSKRIKVTVETGYPCATHVDYYDIPDDWESLSKEKQEKYMDECATEVLHDKCSGYAEIVED